MMGIYLLMVLAIPVLISMIGMLSSRGRITLKEFGILEAVMVIVVAVGYGISRYTSTQDTEVWSGRIVEKERDRVSCEHSYDCNPHPCNCDDKGNCDTCYDTCYDHSYDYDWVLFTSNKERIEIDRVDRQGVNTPKRWADAYVGEPTAEAHDFENFIKANPSTILRRTAAVDQFKKEMIPKYPDKIYDYYRCNRFIPIGLSVPDAKQWNSNLDKINADLGAKKKMNVVVIVASTADMAYTYAIEEAWIGGKKNDFIIVIGAPNYPKIDWVSSVSWTIAEDLKVELRDAILKVGTMEKRDELCQLIRQMTDQKFVHRHMDDFEYLMASVQPGPFTTLFLFTLAFSLSVGLTIYFWKYDPFGDR